MATVEDILGPRPGNVKKQPVPSEPVDAFTSANAGAPMGYDAFTDTAQPSRPMWVSAADFLTGHFPETKDVPEVHRVGNELKVNVPETAEVPFLQDPAMAIGAGTAKAVLKTAAPITSRVAAGAKEAVGWMTGGASEAGVAAVKGVKGVAKSSVEAILGPRPSVESLEAAVKGGAITDLPKYAEGSSINLERLDTTNDVLQFQNGLAKAAEKEIGKRRISWAETRQAAEDLAWDEKDFLKNAKAKGGFSAAEIEAARQINMNALHDLFKSIKEIPADSSLRTDAMRINVADKVNNYIEIMKATSHKSSEAGRALNIHRKMMLENPEFAQDALKQKVIKEILGNNGGQKLADDIITDLQKIDFKDPKAVRDVLQKYHKAGMWDKLYEAWMNGLLSGPSTHLANIFGNTLTFMTKFPETIVSRTIQGKNPLGVVTAESFGAIQGLREGVRAGIRSFVDGVGGDVIQKVDTRHMNAIGGRTGEIVRIPTRLLSAADEFFKAVVYRSEVNRQAYLLAEKEGLKGKDLINRMAEIGSNPASAEYRNIHSLARQESLYRTFNKPLGESGNKIMSFRNSVPGVKYIAPFIRTPVNIFKFALERTPANYAKIGYDLAKGKIGKEQLADELAKPLVGSMISIGTVMSVLDGNITGGAPKSKRERELLYASGWQPYSIKIGDTYYGYNRLEPIGSILGMTADFVNTYRSDDELNKKASELMLSVSKNLVSKTFLQGISGILDAVSDPGRYGQNYVDRMVGSFVPGIVASGARAIDPMMRDPKVPIVDALKARIPGMSQAIPEKPGVKTIIGEIPQERPGTPLTRFISPVPVSKEKDADVMTAVEYEQMKLDQKRQQAKIRKILKGED